MSHGSREAGIPSIASGSKMLQLRPIVSRSVAKDVMSSAGGSVGTTPMIHAGAAQTDIPQPTDSTGQSNAPVALPSAVDK